MPTDKPQADPAEMREAAASLDLCADGLGIHSFTYALRDAARILRAAADALDARNSIIEGAFIRQRETAEALDALTPHLNWWIDNAAENRKRADDAEKALDAAREEIRLLKNDLALERGGI